MALGDSYATSAQLKARMGIGASDTSLDSVITDALQTATSDISGYCGRQFNDAGAVSARVFYPASAGRVLVDDFSTSTGLIIETDPSADGTTWSSTWAAGQWELRPLNGVVDGEPGWPYWEIGAVGRLFPVASIRASVRVTARWGWSAVPPPVESACLILAQEQMKLPDAPFGVAGFGEFGPVRIRQNATVVRLLERYQRDPVKVA